ncbi:hypothetical protein PENSTE_c002G01470 [Penicillium steckii]|uniref:Uncharacterized protein n=1 Tax=Penicillium steckii TaxID=303698 RepID=A0A1V6TUL7_9EURO|nr:hypothetical protein PENSTE_c002G01470 [Penicillium steckii]
MDFYSGVSLESTGDRVRPANVSTLVNETSSDNYYWHVCLSLLPYAFHRRAKLREQLPGYVVPTVFIPLPHNGSLPKTRSKGSMGSSCRTQPASITTLHRQTKDIRERTGPLLLNATRLEQSS